MNMKTLSPAQIAIALTNGGYPARTFVAGRVMRDDDETSTVLAVMFISAHPNPTPTYVYRVHFAEGDGFLDDASDDAGGGFGNVYVTLNAAGLLTADF